MNLELTDWNMPAWPFRHLAICGFARSGSTLLHQMLFSSVENAWIAPDERSASTVPKLIPPVVITKRPLDVYDIKRFFSFRKLFILFIVRDPRDMMTSKHIGAPGEYFIGADYLYHLGEGDPFKREKGSILSTYREILKYQNKKNVALIRYEDMVSNPQQIQQWFKESCGLRFKSEMDSFHQSDDLPLTIPLNGVRAPETSRIKKWLNDETSRERVISQFKQYPELHDILFDLGYETSKNWLDELVNRTQSI